MIFRSNTKLHYPPQGGAPISLLIKMYFFEPTAAREFLPAIKHHPVCQNLSHHPTHSHTHKHTQRQPTSPFSSSYMHKHTHSLTASDSGQRYRDNIYSTHTTATLRQHTSCKIYHIWRHKNTNMKISLYKHFHLKWIFIIHLTYQIEHFKWTRVQRKTACTGLLQKQHWVIIIILSCIHLSKCVQHSYIFLPVLLLKKWNF